MKAYYNEIYDYICSLNIVDTHEHLAPTEEQYVHESDILKEYLKHYFINDLISAGMPSAYMNHISDSNMEIREKWDTIEPFWEKARNTGYGRCLDSTAQGLYGIERIDAGSIEALNSAYIAAQKEGFYKRILKDKCGISVSILDTNVDFDDMNFAENHDREMFRITLTIDPLLLPKTRRHMEFLKDFTNSGIDSLDLWITACQIAIRKAVSLGAIALKCGVAYQRSLQFDIVGRSEAEQAFDEMWKLYDLTGEIKPKKALQDYIMHKLLETANNMKLPVQFHTGLLEGRGNTISNSQPVLLNNLFLLYPDVKFVIYHIGYPYYNVLSALSKMFANVYLDMCWAHIISPQASVNALSEWLDVVPSNKIFGFGGDYVFIDGIYGHQYIARRNIAKVLAGKMEEGVYTMCEAKKLAERILITNPKEVYNI